MSPKSYDEVSAKLGTVWGEYAGWAHSVRTHSLCRLQSITIEQMQVLFTADLKSFASYGLPSPSVPPSPVLTPDRGSTVSEDSPGPSTPLPPSSKKRKRVHPKRTDMKNFTTSTEKDETLAQLEPAEKLSNITEDMSLVDRVKRRRRGVS